jgi:hypothetical protein
MDDSMWNHAVFSKNRDRLLTSDVAQRFFAEVNLRAKKFMSDEHFTVDGTLIQAWASQKSFRAKDGSDDGDGTNFRGQKRCNKTHESTTDADARLYKKRAGSANLDRGLGGGSVLLQPKMAGKRRFDEQTTTQEPYSGVQVEGGFGRDPGRKDAFGAGRAF